MFKIELGVKVESKITGFMGRVTARAEHVNGCNRYFVQPTVDKDGKLPDGYWTDEMELIVPEPLPIERKNNDRGGFPGRMK